MKDKDIKPDEIINSLLKGTFDSIKEESLDIDLSACATIPSSSNGCSLTSDFWLVETETDLTDITLEQKKKNKKKRRPKKATTKTDDENKSAEKCDNDRDDDDDDNDKDEDKKFNLKYNLLFEDLKELATGASDPPDSSSNNTKKSIFACNQCDKTFNDEDNLKKHTKNHKSGASRKDSVIECPDCGKMLKISSMWMHKKIHTDNKRYSCDICGQKFVQKINLTHHTKVHTGEKPFECPQCQKSFPERSHLLRHQRYHSTTRPFKCEKCGKMYKTERCLKVHNLVHLEQRPFVCKVCSKSFISSSKLKQHSNIHTGERPYKCNYCSRDFTNFPNWLKHTRRRHKVDHKTGKLLETVPKYNSKSATKAQKTITQSTNNTVCENIEEITTKTTTTTTTTIKNKSIIIEDRIIKNEHRSVSLTSSEDLIMEQALELEESGLYTINRNNRNLIDAGHFFRDNNIGIKNEFSTYISTPFSPEMEEIGESAIFTTDGCVINNASQEFSSQDLKEEICSYNSSPMSSPNYDFKPYTPLPSITSMTAKNFFLKTNATTLPSVETLLAFSHQQKAAAQSDLH